jgi:hypothetical protein
MERLAATGRLHGDPGLERGAVDAGLWVRRLHIGGSPIQGRCSAGEIKDGDCPERAKRLKYREDACVR